MSAIKYKAEVGDIMQFLFGMYNDHQLHCVVHLSAHLDECRFKKAAVLSIDAIPLIGCRFVEGPGRPYWQDSGFTEDDLVRMVETESVNEEMPKLLTLKTDEFSGSQLIK